MLTVQYEHKYKYLKEQYDILGSNKWEHHGA